MWPWPVVTFQPHIYSLVTRAVVLVLVLVLELYLSTRSNSKYLYLYSYLYLGLEYLVTANSFVCTRCFKQLVFETLLNIDHLPVDLHWAYSQQGSSFTSTKTTKALWRVHRPSHTPSRSRNILIWRSQIMRSVFHSGINIRLIRAPSASYIWGH